MLTESVSSFLLGGAWPLFGSSFMFCVFVASLTRAHAAAITIGIGSLLAVGLVPMLWYWDRAATTTGRPAWTPPASAATEYNRPTAARPRNPVIHAGLGLPTDF